MNSKKNKKRKDRAKCLVYPEDKFKGYWDLFMTLVLLLTCFLTPLSIAFQNEENTNILDDPVSLIIDLLFLIDIIINFNMAFYNEDMEII